jgi:mono/diheme cytochrome c family protein
MQKETFIRMLALVLVGTGLAWITRAPAAQTSTSALAPPPIDLSSPAEIAAGKAIYKTSCSHYCHGPGGSAGLGPALRGHHFDNAYLYMRISKGFPPMPAWEQVYQPKQIWQVIAYIQSLRDQKE